MASWVSRRGCQLPMVLLALFERQTRRLDALGVECSDGGALFYIARNGPVEARAKCAKLLRWATPVVVGLALLRLLAYAFGH